MDDSTENRGERGRSDVRELIATGAGQRCQTNARLSPLHIDEMVVLIGDKRMFMWRAVDSEGEVLDVLVQMHRNKDACANWAGNGKYRPMSTTAFKNGAHRLGHKHDYMSKILMVKW